MVIGLAVTRDGIPVRCWVKEGNTSDAYMVDEIQRDMERSASVEPPYKLPTLWGRIKSGS